MTLAGALERALPRLRAEAEALMPDEYDFGTYGDGWHYDPDLKEDVRDFEFLFSTIGKVMSTTQTSQVEVGDRTAIEIDRTLHIPVATPAVPVGTVARSSDGREFRILAEVTHPQPKSRRFAIEEVLS